jgi:hypothetical protein
MEELLKQALLFFISGWEAVAAVQSDGTRRHRRKDRGNGQATVGMGEQTLCAASQ